MDNWSSDTLRRWESPHQLQVKGEIKFMLIVEKEFTFNILRVINFHNKHNCVVITGKEYPRITIRVVVPKLQDTFMVLIYGLIDLDRDGL